MNPVIETVFKHRSIRKFKNQLVEEEKINYIIKAAQVAPTWCNGQQVSIIAIKDQKRKALFESFCWGDKFKIIQACPIFLIFCADFYRTSLAFEKCGKSKETFEQYITQLDPLIIGAHDVGISIQNAVVVAESLGLGTVDIGGIRNNSLKVAKELNLPKYVIPLIGLCIGYPDDDPEIKPRLPMSAVFFEDKYDTEKAKAGIEEYDETFRKYLSERKSNPRDGNWTQSISNTYSQSIGLANDDYPLIKQQGFISIENKSNIVKKDINEIFGSL